MTVVIGNRSKHDDSRHLEVYDWPHAAAALTSSGAHGAQRRDPDPRTRHPRRRAPRDRRSLRRTAWLARPLLPGRQGAARDRGARSRCRRALDEVAEALATADTFAEAIAAIVAPWRRLLVENDFALAAPSPPRLSIPPLKATSSAATSTTCSPSGGPQSLRSTSISESCRRRQMSNRRSSCPRSRARSSSPAPDAASSRRRPWSATSRPTSGKNS